MQKFVIFLLYLFAYLQVSPAVELNVSKQLAETSDENEIQKLEFHPRPKRFIGALIAIVSTIVTNVAAAVISAQVNRAIERSEARAEDKASTINIVINNNYAQAQALKEEVSRIDSRAGQAIVVNPSGFQCDWNFCQQTGDGQGSLGLCSPDICHCSNGNPILQQCGAGTVFDPLFKICNWPYNVKICGY